MVKRAPTFIFESIFIYPPGNFHPGSFCLGTRGVLNQVIVFPPAIFSMEIEFKRMETITDMKGDRALAAWIFLMKNLRKINNFKTLV